MEVMKMTRTDDDNESVESADIENVDDLLEKDALVTLDEMAQILHCSRRVVYDWTRRSDPKRRPPFLQPGKMILFPKKRFMRWVLNEQMNRTGNGRKNRT
jgi:hypothetical protein